MNPQLAVIFDIDGVLVDSYHAHYQSWLMFARECGFEFTEADFAQTFGRTSRDIIAHYWGDGLTDQRIAEMDARKEGHYRQIIERAFPEMPGARDLIAALHAAGFKLAVGSSGPPENVEASIRGLRAAAYFDARVNGADVHRGKPDPQVFLLAAERLGVPPERCAVVEDAPAGVEAACRAGMIAIALLGTAPAEKLSRAKLIVKTLAELTPRKIADLVLET